MSLSRFRPVLTRSNRVLCRFYYSSSSTFTYRSLLRGVNASYLKDENEPLLRPTSRLSLVGVQDDTYNFTVRRRDRYFSSEPSTQAIIGMPALSPTMTQGNITQWKKREGDKFEPGDILCVIETDKASLEFESLEEGYLAKILVPEGTKDVPVGQPIAITVEDADEIGKVSLTASCEPEAVSPSSNNVNDEEKAKTESSLNIDTLNLPTHLVIGMPALSPTMNQGNLARWRKKEGDKIEVGDVICEIETDKATLEFESLEEGFLAKILTPEGSKDVVVGEAIAVTVEDPNDIDVIRTSFTVNVKTKKDQPVPRVSGNTEKTTYSRISPAAKLLILEHGIASSQFEATGAHGTLLKSDVLSAIKSGKALKSSSKEELSPQTAPQSTKITEAVPQFQEENMFEDIPNSQIRKIIAKRLIESKQTMPHLYLSSDVKLDPLLAFRKELLENHNVKVSVNDIVIKAVAAALRIVPKANAFWDDSKGEITLCDSVDISIAVATDKGLITPIVKNADQKPISSISSEVKQLAEKARAGKLAPHEFQGGTFSISNLGMYPVDHFCAIINPPQSGILAVGRGTKVVEPVVGSDGLEKPAVVNRMWLTLSADHRVFCGEVAGAFLAALRESFEDVRRLIL